ncbi:MAG: diphosphomevalonate decarboxylase [Gammaproteobacteria bacterium HGW-Gammaproteobacteria-8]|nr:MAG: diphosphomevalonate decarboxylase [Gammaproteobacteria bacterium HGW-Gammaproteobacteria-8]
MTAISPAAVQSSGSASARAGANFALVKYWGKRDPVLNLPDVGSISITLDALHTETRVRLDPALEADRFVLDGRADAPGADRVVALLDRFRALADSELYARVESHNNFPTGAGLASSASGFAALVEAASAAWGLDLPAARRSELARLGSGSAARSIFGGFVEMARGERADGSDSVARVLADGDHWPLEVVVAVSERGRKPVGSTDGMQLTARTSPFYRAWVEHQQSDLDAARSAILARDFERLAAVSEASALAMHGLAMSARPGLLYWNGTTMECLHRVRALRAAGQAVFFTVDAGPQVKAICLPDSADAVAEALAELPGVTGILRSGLGPGAERIA